VPLSEVQLRHLEGRLREERARASDALARALADWSAADGRGRAGDLTAFPLHAADLGTDATNDALDAANATRLSRELADIDAA
jgi:RNA polymerase-binding transcription factor DksA